jgi:CubicO group peptidase (beta-lactamase class C family)
MPEVIMAIVERYSAESDLGAVIVRVTQAGEEIVTAAIGESMPGVPATTDMHFRNGAVAFSLLATLTLVQVDKGVLGLDDTIDAWLPDLPDAERVTVRMLLNMTSGYRDHVQSPNLIQALYEDPFREIGYEELLGYSFEQPRLFEPGANWEYSHTGYVILGKVVEEATGEQLDVLMQREVLDPLGLTETANSFTAEIPEPILHAYSSERRDALAVKPGTHFLEESTFWSPTWTTARGTIQTTTIVDMAASMEAVGAGTLLSAESHAAQFDRSLVGFGAPLDGCNSCHTLTEDLVYGLGVWMIGPWTMQNPLFYGYSGTAGHHAGTGVSIAVAVTYREGSFDDTGDYAYGNVSTSIFKEIAALFEGDGATPAAG